MSNIIAVRSWCCGKIFMAAHESAMDEDKKNTIRKYVGLGHQVDRISVEEFKKEDFGLCNCGEEARERTLKILDSL